MESAHILEDCLKLLKGERDEQRLAGLLLVTKICEKNDNASILKAYNALGVQFLDRLLYTGMGRRSSVAKDGDEREAYLRLAVTILAGFCRVPEVASSSYMVGKVPIILTLISERSGSSFVQECYEFFLLIGTASEVGLIKFYESGGIDMLSSQISSFSDGSPQFEHALRLLQLVLSKLPQDSIITQHAEELAYMVVAIARQFAILHSALKFESLHVLTLLLSSAYSAALHDALREMPSEKWMAQLRAGIVAVLQNRVVSSEKLEALLLAESIMSVVGERWLVEPTNMEVEEDPMPVDRCFFLVMECSRVEIAVLLNELAYLKYEASNTPAAQPEMIYLKQRNVAIAFSLIEKIIKLISNMAGSQDNAISESSMAKVLKGLNETVGGVLEYLKDAKDHGHKKGDDLLASVRIVGSYLVEAPCACKEQVIELLDFMLSVEGQDESCSFRSICFLLPMLYQATMELEGCRLLTSFGGHKVVVQYLVTLITENQQMLEDSGSIFLACDTIMNILLMREEVWPQMDAGDFVHLLQALPIWTEDCNDSFTIMMASSICSLVFEMTSEDILVSYPKFDYSTLQSLSQMLVRSLEIHAQEEKHNHLDLFHIVESGHARWADRFPLVRQSIESG